jgi:CBS domain containing-hemolysin-like protein
MDDGGSISGAFPMLLQAGPVDGAMLQAGRLEMMGYLLLTVLLVLLNGFFVAAEFALVKVRSTRLKELADDGHAGARLTLGTLRQLDVYLSATQVGITLASLGLGWVGEPAVSNFLIHPLLHLLHLQVGAGTVKMLAYIAAFFVITFVHIVFGEQAPKWMAIQRAERTILAMVRPLLFFTWLFRPFSWLVNTATNAVLRAFRITPESAHELAHSEEELRMIISASGSDHGGTLRETQAELLDNVFEFGHRLARQVMTHRTEIVALDLEDTLAEHLRIAQEDDHTRYLVTDGGIDAVVGFVHSKDLFALAYTDRQGDLRTAMREVLVAPETVRVDVLLRQMQRERQHVAVLVDEYGGTSGLVTIFDLLEELVGDIPDEFEPTEEAEILALGDGHWRVDGRLAMSELAEMLGREVSCEESCDTVGGFAFYAFGRIPEVGDETHADDITLRVVEMDAHRVSRVEITAAPATHDEDEEDGVLARGR